MNQFYLEGDFKQQTLARRAISIELNDTISWSEVLYQLPPKSIFNPGDVIELELTYFCKHFIETPVFPILASYFKWLRDNDIQVECSLNTTGDCNFHYAARMGLFDYLGLEYEYPHKPHDPDGRFIPITHLDGTGYGLDDRFVEKIGEELDLPQSLTDSIFFSVGEMAANVKQHAQIESGAVLFGQSFPKRREASLIVVDPGRGIHQAFLKGSNSQYHNLTEAECLEQCLEHGVTCGNGRGYGLHLINDIISRNLGTLRIISGSHYVSVVHGIKSVRECPHWEGVIVICDFDLDNKVDLSEVMTSNGHQATGTLW